MPRYAILTHDHPFPHWDFLLEWGDACRTWRLLAEPAPGHPIPAEPLPDHRLHYLDYEGPVSGNRGVVAQWDAGIYDVASSDPQLLLRLRGTRRLASAQLNMHPAKPSWLFSQ
jgi:hypothetical protein